MSIEKTKTDKLTANMIDQAGLTTGSSQGEAAWRHFAGHFAWPTLLMAAGVIMGSGMVWTLVLAGSLPLWAGFLLATTLAYLAFTPVHEASHGNLAGYRRRWRWLETMVGWSCGVMLWAPYAAFRTLHLQHHGHTNDPEHDPDFWVVGKSRFGVLLRCATIVPHYYYRLLGGILRSLPRLAKQQRSTLLALTVYWAGFIALAVNGLFAEAVGLWLLPALTAGLLLSFAFDWLPHRPHRSRERYRDTRILLFPGLSWLMTGQNFHLVHHLYPRIPFYRYGDYFSLSREELESKGARIDDWRAREETPEEAGC